MANVDVRQVWVLSLWLFDFGLSMVVMIMMIPLRLLIKNLSIHCSIVIHPHHFFCNIFHLLLRNIRDWSGWHNTTLVELKCTQGRTIRVQSNIPSALCARNSRVAILLFFRTKALYRKHTGELPSDATVKAFPNKKICSLSCQKYFFPRTLNTGRQLFWCCY